MSVLAVPLITPAHSQQVTNTYHIAYPAHAPRTSDPHYQAFNAFHRANQVAAVCYTGRRVGFDECKDAHGDPVIQPAAGNGLELHHHFLEFATVNAVSLVALEVDYPDLTDADKVAAWAETDANFLWLCAKHHRGFGGVHHAAAADWEASQYIQNLLSAPSSPHNEDDASIQEEAPTKENAP